jgi:recombination protein RecA
MAKTKEKQEAKGIQAVLENLNKTYGVGTVMTLDNKTTGNYDLISTGSIGFDNVTLGVGGFVKGKLYELMGWEGCLAEDTYIKFINVRKDGIVQDCKGGTIKSLYERFQNRNEKTIDTEFNVISINEEEKVFRNKIADVVKSGVKECFELKTKKGYSIKATKDHKFYVGYAYLPLSELKVGSKVFVHNNTPFSKSQINERKSYYETTIKWYYKGKPKKINGNFYFREKVHRLVYEAHMNGLTYLEYKEMLNNCTMLPKDWWTIPEGYEIHHINEHRLNNDMSNLQLIDNRSHARLHALDKHNNLRFMVVDDEIVSIESVGEMETYDIKCYFPYNNFIAEGIVVHNSGKSTICGHAAANCQANGGTVLYIDGEHALDKTYFQALGVDTSKMLISQPSCGEEGFNIAIDLINTGDIDLVIIDSDSSLIPKKVLDGDVGDSSIGYKARLNSNAYPKLKTALSNNNTCVIVVSQYREKIGVMFGNPTTTQGGHALKFYSDVRIEVSKTGAKDGDVQYGNITKVKAVKNKMASPFKKSEFEIVYGEGIDRMKEIMELGNEYEIFKKWGQTITFNDIKYTLEDFGKLVMDNQEFYNELKTTILQKIKNIKPEENVENQIQEDSE